MFGINNTNSTNTGSPVPGDMPLPGHPSAPVMPPVTDAPDPLATPLESPKPVSSLPPVLPPSTPADDNHFPPIEPPAHVDSDIPSAPTAPSMPAAKPPTGDLIQLKQQALQSLAPLVSQLDQTPEERFKTTMMMLQASDNADLVKEAYAAANEITDEKARAHALLDVVNEINYFTQNANGGKPANPLAS